MNLIELLRSFTDPQNANNRRKQNALLEQCLNASQSDLENLSLLLGNSPDILPTLKTFISHLYSHAKNRSTIFSNFTSNFVVIIITRNLHHSGNPDFEELLHN